MTVFSGTGPTLMWRELYSGTGIDMFWGGGTETSGSFDLEVAIALSLPLSSLDGGVSYDSLGAM